MQGMVVWSACVCVCVCVSERERERLCVYGCIFIMCMRVYVCSDTMYVCMCVCVHVCMCACVHVWY